ADRALALPPAAGAPAALGQGTAHAHTTPPGRPGPERHPGRGDRRAHPRPGVRTGHDRWAGRGRGRDAPVVRERARGPAGTLRAGLGPVRTWKNSVNRP